METPCSCYAPRNYFQEMPCILKFILVNLGVMLQTRNNDMTNLIPKYLRDNEESTCFVVPTHNSDQSYWKARLSWPIYDTPNPDFDVIIKGQGLMCDEYYQLVYIKFGVTWGDPSYTGHMKQCRMENDTDVECKYSCNPSPDYTEAVFIYIKNLPSTSNVQLCEVIYEQ